LALLTASVALWAFVVWGGYKSSHYVLAIFLGIVGLYEFSPLAIYWFVLENSDLLSIGRFVTEVGTNTITLAYNLVLLLFIVTLVVVYGVIAWIKQEVPQVANAKELPIHVFHVVPLALLIFGLVSIWTGAAVARASDYQWGASEFGAEYQNPVIFYGRALYVVGVALLVVLVCKKRWWWAAAYVVCLLPITFELFATGRRQAFAPAAILIALCVLYLFSKKAKLILLGALVLLFFAASTLQFALRSDYYVDSWGWSGISLAVFPAVLELTYAGVTSLRSYIWANQFGVDLGLHILVGVLDGVPFFNPGSYLVEQRVLPGSDIDQSWVSPRGALTMTGDVILAAGSAGAVILALLLAPVLFILDSRVKRFFSNGKVHLRAGDLLMICLASTVLIQYRNGFVAGVNSVIYLTVIYVALLFVPLLLLRATGRQMAVNERRERFS
jgi:hypothetical protein